MSGSLSRVNWLELVDDHSPRYIRKPWLLPPLPYRLGTGATFRNSESKTISVLVLALYYAVTLTISVRLRLNRLPSFKCLLASEVKVGRILGPCGRCVLICGQPMEDNHTVWGVGVELRAYHRKGEVCHTVWELYRSLVS
jgi:hypothetical protein